MKASLWNQGYEAWAEHRNRQLLPSITCLLPSSCPSQGFCSLPSPSGNEHAGHQWDPCYSICVQRAQPKQGVSVYHGFIFTANSSVKIQERPPERSPAHSWWHGQNKPCPGASTPCFHLSTRHREQRQTAPQTKVDFSAGFIPSPSKKSHMVLCV